MASPPASGLQEYVRLVRGWRRRQRLPVEFPRKLKPRLVALHSFLMGLEPDTAYTEYEVNRIIRDRNLFAIDHVQLRRILVEHGMLQRQAAGSEYPAAEAYLHLAEWDAEILSGASIGAEPTGTPARDA